MFVWHNQVSYQKLCLTLPLGSPPAVCLDFSLCALPPPILLSSHWPLLHPSSSSVLSFAVEQQLLIAADIQHSIDGLDNNANADRALFKDDQDSHDASAQVPHVCPYVWQYDTSVFWQAVVEETSYWFLSPVKVDRGYIRNWSSAITLGLAASFSLASVIFYNL